MEEEEHHKQKQNASTNILKGGINMNKQLFALSFCVLALMASPKVKGEQTSVMTTTQITETYSKVLTAVQDPILNLLKAHQNVFEREFETINNIFKTVGISEEELKELWTSSDLEIFFFTTYSMLVTPFESIAAIKYDLDTYNNYSMSCSTLDKMQNRFKEFARDSWKDVLYFKGSFKGEVKSFKASLDNRLAPLSLLKGNELVQVKQILETILDSFTDKYGEASLMLANTADSASNQAEEQIEQAKTALQCN